MEKQLSSIMLRCQGRNGTDLAQECGICDTPRAYSLWSLVPIMKWMCIGVSCIGATGMESMVHRERWERDTPECDCMGTKRPYNSLNYTERRSQLVFQKDTRKRTPHRSQQFPPLNTQKKLLLPFPTPLHLLLHRLPPTNETGWSALSPIV